MELNLEEKDVIKKVASVTRMDEKIVNKIFQGLLVVMDMNLYKNYNNITIPYLARLAIKYRSVIVESEQNKVITDVDIDTRPSDFLYREIDRLIDKEPLLMEEYVKERIEKILYDKINLDK